MGGRGKEWTTGEIAELERLAKRHLTSAQIASIMGRTKDAVRGQAWHRGIKLQTTVRPWTCSDVNVLVDMFRRGVTYADIGRRLGRSRYAIVSKARALGLRRRSSHRWTDEEDARLLRMRSDGVPRKECAAAIGVSRHAVDGRLELLRKRGRW
jgi:hypothetical protein